MKNYKERSNFIPRTTFFEMPISHAKMCLKSASKKLNFVKAKAESRMVTNSTAASITIKTILCEPNNILFSKK